MAHWRSGHSEIIQEFWSSARAPGMDEHIAFLSSISGCRYSSWKMKVGRSRVSWLHRLSLADQEGQLIASLLLRM